MTTDVLRSLPPVALRGLALALRRGLFDSGIHLPSLQQTAGSSAPALDTELRGLLAGGFTMPTLAVLVESMAAARQANDPQSDAFDFVISGPEVPGVPVLDTASAMHSLIEGASSSVEIAGYAFHNGAQLFERLAARMQDLPSLKVLMMVDIARTRTDTSLDSEIVWRFARQFWEKQWPWHPRPELWHDPRSLSSDALRRSALHAKCIITDSANALITSANFTSAAQHRNIEAGVLIRHPQAVSRLANYFAGLRSQGTLTPVHGG
jgi:hypothetical protein